MTPASSTSASSELARWSPADRWQTEVSLGKRCELMKELCRLFDATPVAMMNAVAHGRLTIDGYVIRPWHLRRWNRRQLIGRYARLFGRQAQLYGSTPVARLRRGDA